MFMYEYLQQKNDTDIKSLGQLYMAQQRLSPRDFINLRNSNILIPIIQIRGYLKALQLKRLYCFPQLCYIVYM